MGIIWDGEDDDAPRERLATRPTVYLSNAGSAPTPGHHGPGQKWLAMAKPRDFEIRATVGHVPALTPDRRAPEDVQTGRISQVEYRADFENRLLSEAEVGRHPFPGQLVGVTWAGARVPVADGDTLLCGCSRWAPGRDRAHPCHLELTVPYLVAAGWRVVLWGFAIDAAYLRPDDAHPLGAVYPRWENRLAAPVWHAHPEGGYSADDLGWPKAQRCVGCGLLVAGPGDFCGECVAAELT